MALALLALGCAEDLIDDHYGVMDLYPYYGDGAAPNNPAGGLPRSLAPVRGYSKGADIELYDFGLVPFNRAGVTTTPTTAAVNPMYVFFDGSGNPMLARPVRSLRTGVWHLPGGNPTLGPNADPTADRTRPHSLRPKRVIVDPRRNTSAHQRPIIDVGPEDLATRYTGLWEIVEVTAQGDYIADDIKSARTLQRGIDEGKLSSRPTGKVINCPLVDERSEVVASLSSRAVAQPLVEVWYRRKLGFCLLANGWETLAHGDELLGANQDAARLATFDVMRVTVQVGGETQGQLQVPVGRLFVPTVSVAMGDGAADFRFSQNQIIEERPRRSEADPPGYTPIRWLWDVTPPLDAMTMRYVPGTMRSIEGIDARNLRARGGGPWVRNVASAGPVPTCGPADAAGACADGAGCERLGLTCNETTCLCDLPTVGWGQLCGPGFQRCRRAPLDGEQGFAPDGFLCHPLEPRGFCVPRCDATAMDTSPQSDLDSRCGNMPGFICATPGETSTRLDDRKESVCVRTCRTTDAPEQSVCRLPPASAPATSAVQRCQSQRMVTGCAFDDTLYPF